MSTIEVHTGGPLFGHPARVTKGRAARAVAVADEATRARDRWPWVFDVLAFHMEHKPTIPSALNRDMWSSQVIADHTDYSAAGTLKLAERMVWEADNSTIEGLKATLSTMPAALRVEQESTLQETQPAREGSATGSQPGTRGDKETEDGEDAGGGHDKAAGNRGVRKAAKEAPDYTDKDDDDGSKAGPSRKRHSTTPLVIP